MGRHFLVTLLISATCLQSMVLTDVTTDHTVLLEATSPKDIGLMSTAVQVPEFATLADNNHVTSDQTGLQEATSPKDVGLMSTAVELPELTTPAENNNLGPQKLELLDAKFTPVASLPSLMEEPSHTTPKDLVMSASMEQLSTVTMADNAASTAEKGSKISSQSPTTGLYPSSAAPASDMTMTPSKGKDDGPRIPAINPGFINVSMTPPEVTMNIATRQHNPSATPSEATRSVTNQPENETSKTPIYIGTRNPSSPGIDHGGNDGHNHKTTTKPATPKPPKTQKKSGEEVKLIAIVVGIIILGMLLMTMMFMLIRRKKRSGSFRTRSKRGDGRDVWAGQVPELGDGKAAQDPSVMENGRARPKTEVELTTFATGEKKEDSVGEVNELEAADDVKANGKENLVKEDHVQEKAPLLEESSSDSQEPEDKKDEDFQVPSEEQELLGNGVKQ